MTSDVPGEVKFYCKTVDGGIGLGDGRLVCFKLEWLGKKESLEFQMTPLSLNGDHWIFEELWKGTIVRRKDSEADRDPDGGKKGKRTCVR